MRPALVSSGAARPLPKCVCELGHHLYLVYFFAFLTFLSLFNFSWVSFLWFALFVIFYLLRPPAIKFGIDNNPDVGPNNMFDASGNICTMCCNTESNTAHMLNHYAIQKQHAV